MLMVSRIHYNKTGFPLSGCFQYFTMFWFPLYFQRCFLFFLYIFCFFSVLSFYLYLSVIFILHRKLTSSGFISFHSVDFSFSRFESNSFQFEQMRMISYTFHSKPCWKLKRKFRSKSADLWWIFGVLLKDWAFFLTLNLFVI